MKKPVDQHIIPKTYLKHFAIDPKDRKLKSLVWIKRFDHNKTMVSKESIDSRKFKICDFYTVECEDSPYVIEDYFSSEIEPVYNDIIDEVELELNLSQDCRSKLILWLYNIKYRNTYNRTNIERNLRNIVHFTFSYQNEFDRLINPAPSPENISREARGAHLQSLLRQDLLSEFEKGMGTKHWIILKSRPESKFITNDNPGFSLNVNLGVPDFNTLTSYFATNHEATNYYILSPKYCLMISPFWKDTPLEVSLKNQTINYKITNVRHIQFINKCTSITRNKLVIASDKTHFS